MSRRAKFTDFIPMQEELRAVKERIAALQSENERLRAINATLMGDDEDAPRYTTKRLKAEVAKAVAAARAEASAAVKVKPCAICGGPFDNDLLTDICKNCEAEEPWLEDEALTTQPAAPQEAEAVAIPSEVQMNQAFYVDVCRAEDRLKEFVDAGRKLLDSLPAHWHGDAETDLHNLCADTYAVLNPHMHTPYQVEQATKRYGKSVTSPPAQAVTEALKRIVALDEAMGHELTVDHAHEAVRIAMKALTATQEAGR